MITRSLKSFLVLIFLSSAVQAQYYGYVDVLPYSAELRPRHMLHVPLKENSKVKDIIIFAEGTWGNAMMEVMIGQGRWSVHVPGVDPWYGLTVNQDDTTLRFMHRSGGPIRITRIWALLESVVPPPPPPPPTPEEVLRAELKEIIAMCEKLVYFSSLQEFNRFLLPIKTHALRMDDVLSDTDADDPEVTHEQLQVLAGLIHAQEFLERKRMNSASTEFADRLLKISRRIKNRAQGSES